MQGMWLKKRAGEGEDRKLLLVKYSWLNHEKKN